VIENGWFIQNMLIECFVFCCKLFNSQKCKSSLGHDGFGDWRHTSERLKNMKLIWSILQV
jgi:hypothetical protein